MLLFKGTKGLNIETDPARINFNPETGVQDLAASKNIDIDDTGRISRRKGFERKIIGNYHSGFSCNNYALCVIGDALTVLEANYSTNAIRQVTIGRRMKYVKIGEDVYYCNGVETGRVNDRVSYPWIATSYNTVETRILSGPVVGDMLGFYKGRIYIITDKIIYFSEANSRNHFDLARNVIIESSTIRMFAPVMDGIYISNEKEIVFYRGNSVNEFERVVVADYPAVEGSDITVMMSQIGEAEEGGKAVLMATGKGLAAGFKSGNFVNLSEDKVTYPGVAFGAGIFKNRKYIVTLQP